MHSKVWTQRTAAGIVLAALAAPAVAQDFWSAPPADPQDEWFVLKLGGIVNRFDTKVRVDGEGRRGSEINLEANNLDKSLASFEGAFTWRIAKKHRIDFEFYNAERSGTRDYASSIDIGDESFPLGATVAVTSNSFVTNVNYRYSFIQEPGLEVAALAGLYYGKLEYDINAVGTAGGGVQRSYQKSFSTDVPLPMLGATVDWYPNRHLRFNARIQGIKADIDEIDGHAFLFSTGVEYMFSRGFGVGMRYSYTDVEVDATSSNFNGTINWSANSVSAYARFVF